MTIFNRNRSILGNLTVFFLFMLSLLILLWPAVGALAATTTERVSLDSNGLAGNGNSNYSSISADGRYVAFLSAATNLVVADTNGESDVFVHDRNTGLTTRVSLDSGGTEGNSNSYHPTISADGRYIAFDSNATNLVASDTNGAWDVFVHDRNTGQTTRISLDSGGTEGNGNSGYSSISADGRYVAFLSAATNLVVADTNGESDVFVHDRNTGLTTRVSLDSGGTEGNSNSYHPTISADGRYIAFDSYATNLVAGDTNGEWDVFVHDRNTGQTNRVSLDSNSLEGNWFSGFPSISADGRYIAFESDASNLVADDANGTRDIFVHDRNTGKTTRVSLDSDGTEGNGLSGYSSISADGRYVAFDSEASNLVVDDTNGTQDVFVHDRNTGKATRVSLDSDRTEGNGISNDPSISADGRYVAFESAATNLVVADTNGEPDVFVHDTGKKALSNDSSTGGSNGGCFINSVLD